VPSTGDERGHAFGAAAAAEAIFSGDGLAAPETSRSTLLAVGTLLGVAAASFADPKAGAKGAGWIVSSEPLINWLRESSKDNLRTCCAGELVAGSNWITGTIGTAIRKAKTEFDPGGFLAKLFVGAGLAGAVVFSVVDGSGGGVGADAV
jgi:hypothetical protein